MIRTGSRPRRRLGPHSGINWPGAIPQHWFAAHDEDGPTQALRHSRHSGSSFLLRNEPNHPRCVDGDQATVKWK